MNRKLALTILLRRFTMEQIGRMARGELAVRVKKESK